MKSKLIKATLVRTVLLKNTIFRASEYQHTFKKVRLPAIPSPGDYVLAGTVKYTEIVPAYEFNPKGLIIVHLSDCQLPGYLYHGYLEELKESGWVLDQF